MNISNLIMGLLLSVQVVLLPITYSSNNVSAVTAVETNQYAVELAKWGIYNDGTHSVSTTTGINNMLKWANKNGKTKVLLPSGTYLIAKDSHINMVSNMTFEMPSNAILQKETNAKENYRIMYIGYGINNVTIRGGTYRGDKDTHDYSKKEFTYTYGTHEFGYGIFTQGAQNVRIDGIKAENLTGDGLMLSGHGTMMKGLRDDDFKSGALDDKGRPINNAKKIRTKLPLNFKNAIFQKERYFELSNAVNLPGKYDIYIFKANGTLIKKLTNKAVRDIIDIPEGANYFHLVFNKPVKKDIYIEYWNRVVTKNIVVENSEFAFNRRQGITVGGADNVLIRNNILHDIKGTMPQSGIDLEGGFNENGHRNSNITIRGNSFYNNAKYDLILYDGHDAIVEDNHFASKGAIGLAVSIPFKGALIKNNHFDGSRIAASDDATFINNRMNDSSANFSGPNMRIDGMELTDSLFLVRATVPFGVSIANVTMKNNHKSESGLALWGEPVHIKNMTIIGESTLRSIVGNVAEGSIFDNLKVLDYNTTYGLPLPPATYNNCEFIAAEGGTSGTINAEFAGKYVFNNCSFTTSSLGYGGLRGTHLDLDLTVKNSTFEQLGNAPAISMKAAKNVLLENNTINASRLTSENTEIIKMNDYWNRNGKHDILKATIRGNTITSNIAAIGISTKYPRVGATPPPFTIENNKLFTAILALKANDKVKGNVLK